MPAINELMFLVIWIITWIMVYSLPAALTHALIRKFWIACATISFLAFVCGYGVALYCESMYVNVDFPINFVVFALISSMSGLVTGLLVGFPFVLYRRGWIVSFWTRRPSHPGDPAMK